MPDLLLELRSEEIPARMQRKAAGDLKKMLTDGLVEAGLTYEGCQEYWTPRRLTLDVRGLTARSKDIREEIKGPSTKAPAQAVEGFLRKAGLSDVSQAHVHSDPKKGDFYVAHIAKPGRAAEEIIAELVPGIIRSFPWPKSMRWGPASAKPGSLRWVRPLQSILCTFGPETEEPVVVDFEIDGIRAGNVTYGHRFHAPGAITVRRFEDYAAKLEAARVVIDAERRKQIILSDARNLAFANGLDLVEDDGLLEEVAGLVEWPVVLLGEFDQDFLAIPAEVIRLTIRANQKCFVTRSSLPLEGRVVREADRVGSPVIGRDPIEPPRATELTPPGQTASGHPPLKGEGTLAPRFVLTANIEAKDGGAEIAHGNGKVVRARLSDALYFWKTDQADLPDLDQLKNSAEKFGLDLKKPLDQRMARLDHLDVTFHAKLGTQGQRVERIARLAEELAPVVGADPILARRAAVLAKADLQTEVVGEFPELQGAMGRKYALLQGEDVAVATALEDHYKPQGPSDRVPTDPVSITVALADKLDTLVGFWAIDEKPTGSKDPYALRRAALGVIRILVENGVRLPFHSVLFNKLTGLGELQVLPDGRYEVRYTLNLYGLPVASFVRTTDKPLEFAEEERLKGEEKTRFVTELLSFFYDRLKVYLRDKGARHDLIDAVLAGGGSLPLEGRVVCEADRVGSAATGTTSPENQVESAEMTPPDQPAAGHPPLKGEGDSVALNDDLLTIVRRVEALGLFLDTEDGKNLLAGARRAANILAAEEKKGTAVAARVEPALFRHEAEKALFSAMNQAESQAGEAIQKEDCSGALAALSALREPVDSFFEHVLVNDEDVSVRANRLALLARIRAATGQVADFSRIAG